MSDIIDINVFETIDEVTINATPNVIEVNITRTTSTGSNQSLSQTLEIGNETGGTDIFLNNEDAIALENTSLLQKGTYDFGANGGISRICGVGFEDMWQGGIRHVFDGNGFIRNSTNAFNIIPDVSFDVTLRFKIGSIWTLDDGTNYICTDATEGAAVWELYNVIPTINKYYGAWQDEYTQTADADNVGYAMKFHTQDITPNGISIVNNDSSNPTRITFANSGIYNLQFSSQFQNKSNQLADVTIWLRKNGNDFAGSAGFISVPNSHGGIEGHNIAAWNYFLEVSANDYYELVWSTTNHNDVTMHFYSAGNPPPSAASVILTITNI